MCAIPDVGDVDSSLPLVSAVVMFYRQERYVEEVLSSLFSQTYPNLELVISDDCSPDGTWKCVEKTMTKLRGENPGVKVVLNRNRQNMGIALHAQYARSLTHGELVFSCGGDDVSLPERISNLVAKWLQTGKRAAVLGHQAIRIDDAGRRLGLVSLQTVRAGPLGAVAAYRRDVFEGFPPITEKGAYEDTVYGYRAQMVGEMVFVDKPLVLYRVGSGVSSALRGRIDVAIRGFVAAKASTRQLKKDVAFFAEHLSPDDVRVRLEKLDAFLAHLDDCLLLWAGKSFGERLSGFSRIRPQRLLSGAGITCLVLLLPKCLAGFVMDHMYSMSRMLKK